MLMNKEKITLLHLSLINKCGVDRIRRLYNFLQSQKRCLSEIYTFSVRDFCAVGFSENDALLIYNGLQDKEIVLKELDLIQKHGITLCAWYEDEYPESLKTIHLPPVILYIQGVLPSPNIWVGIVGARKGDSYGYDVASLLVSGLVPAGIGIVSGGAAGIDTYAHQAALNAGGSTAVILGGGLLKPFPASNKKLFEAVVQSGGAVVSAFPLLADPMPGQFPARNRIIAGMAKMTVVVQAAQKSGALITAEYALQEGRLVGAVPGSIFNPLSNGCHYLINQGARIVSSACDILEECGVDYGIEDPSLVDKEVVKQDLKHNDEIQDLTDVKNFLKKEINNQEPLDRNSLLIYYCKNPLSSLELSLIMKVSERDINDMLFDLQLEGKVEQDFAGLWKKVS